MEKTLILMVTRTTPSAETQECIDRLGCPSIIKLRGMANLPKARSHAFDQALTATEGTEIDTVLCLDDDMVFKTEEIVRLVDFARTRNELVSAVALSHAGIVAARPHTPLVTRVRKRWLSGLSCMAIPLARLRQAAQNLSLVHGKLLPRPWCLTGEHEQLPGEWIGEDLWFCLHFDGVEMVPIAVGHLKPIAIWPDDATLRQF
jgi:hypothetical protein